MKPILKWAGGKSWAVEYLNKFIPEFDRYVEPFVGGGAFFFALNAKQAVINDLNKDLICTYEMLRDKCGVVIAYLKKFQEMQDSLGLEKFYYEARKIFNSIEQSNAKKAALFIYLNSKCHCGLTRYNKSGGFNVPLHACGPEKRKIPSDKRLMLVSAALANTEIHRQDFYEIIENCHRGDFILADPPYDPITTTANFTAYTKDGFAWEDQVRLRLALQVADEKGAKWFCFNNDTERIRELYKDYPEPYVLPVKRRICAREKTKATELNELCFKNF